MVMPAETELLGSSDVATILTRISGLLKAFHESDLALQDALSALASQARSSHEIIDLQHVDLVTQTHADLAALLAELGICLSGRPRGRSQLKRAMTLRSLQDSLIEATDDGDDTVPGDLALF